MLWGTPKNIIKLLENVSPPSIRGKGIQAKSESRKKKIK